MVDNKPIHSLIRHYPRSSALILRTVTVDLVTSIGRRFYYSVALRSLVLLLLSTFGSAQISQTTEAKPANIIGTVIDVNGDTVPNAMVVLKGPDPHDERTVASNQNGYFELHDVTPGVQYQITISAKDFSDWKLPAITLKPGEFKILVGIQLRIETERTEVNVKYDPVEVATEQFKAEEKQRGFGLIPNVYVLAPGQQDKQSQQRKER